MNRPQRSRSSNRRRRSPSKKQAQSDLWKTPSELPDVEAIEPPHEVGALLRSLGDPPMTGGTAAGHYFNAVTERAAAVALALALSADLLVDPDDDDS